MIYRVVTNTLTGCLEAESLAGTQSATIGCVWPSTEIYNCQVDCDGCSLGGVTASATYLGYNASALNNGVSVGKSSSTTCTAIAIGCGATSYDNGIAIGANLTACCDEILIGDKVVITDNTVINGCDGGCSDVVAINATATDNCQVVINGLIDVTCASVTLGCVATVNTKVAIGNGATAAADSVAIGNGATATCGIDIKSNSNAEVCISNRHICIGHCINSNDECGFVAGNNINVCSDLFNTVVGSHISLGCESTGGTNVIIGYGNELVNCAYTGLTVVGAFIDECGIDFKGCINDGDVILGIADCAFQLCASNGYLYSAGGSCLMTGRILNSAAELPASNCELLLYYVP